MAANFLFTMPAQPNADLRNSDYARQYVNSSKHGSRYRLPAPPAALQSVRSYRARAPQRCMSICCAAVAADDVQRGYLLTRSRGCAVASMRRPAATLSASWLGNLRWRIVRERP
jgi:hypothetical protein